MIDEGDLLALLKIRHLGQHGGFGGRWDAFFIEHHVFARPSELVETLVPRNRKGPGLEGVRIEQAVAVFEDPQEGLLHHVLGQLAVEEHLQAEGVDRSLIAVVERYKRKIIALLKGLDQCLVVGMHGGSGHVYRRAGNTLHEDPDRP